MADGIRGTFETPEGQPILHIIHRKRPDRPFFLGPHGPTSSLNESGYALESWMDGSDVDVSHAFTHGSHERCMYDHVCM